MRPLSLYGGVVYMAVALGGCDGKSDLELPPDDTGSTDNGETGETAETADTDETAETGDSSETGETGDSTDTSDTAPAPTDHCGTITVDETWSAADNPHTMSCDVDVQGATLTIEAGVEVAVAEGKALYVANDDHPGALIVTGTPASPVRFLPEGDDLPAQWSGVSIGATATGASLDNLEIRGAGSRTHGGLYVDAVEIAVDGLTVVGSGNTGVDMQNGARFRPNSRAIVVSGSETYPVYMDCAQMHTLPADGSNFTGNGTDAIDCHGGYLETSVTWQNLGVPYVIESDVKLQGDATNPAILTIDPGVTLQFDAGQGMLLSQSGFASGLVARGTAEAPITFTALGASTRGFWDGIAAFTGTVPDQFILSYVHLDWAGGDGYRTGLYAEDAVVQADHLWISGSEDAGFRLLGTARFADGSQNINVTDCDAPAYVTATAIDSLQAAVESLTGNDHDYLHIGPANTDVSASATWGDLGVPYWVDDDVLFEGTAESPAVLTLDPGTLFYMGDSTAFFFAKDGGAAGFVAVGTEAAPIVFTPGSSNTPGVWDGIGLYDNVEDASAHIEYVEIGYGAGTQLSGNLHLDGCAPVIDHVYLHDAENYGLYLSSDAEPVLGADLRYANNGDGDVNR